MERFSAQQIIDAPLEQVWDFFVRPENLSYLTPPYMKMRITHQDKADEIFPGMIIRYKVSPILGIPLGWETLISEVKKESCFVDEQQRGPFSLWRHRHDFIVTDSGVLMTDTVDYELPFSYLGKIVHSLFVRKQIQNIFEFRKHQIDNIFRPA